MDNTTIDSLYELLWSRVNSYMFEIALKLDVFTILQDTDKCIEELALICNLPVSSTRVLLQYLCGLGLVQFKNNKFTNSNQADKYLTNKQITDDLKGYTNRSVSDFEQKLKYPGKQPWYQLKKENKSISGASGIDESFFNSDLRHGWRVKKGEELAAMYDFSHHSRLLDIGGASGGWCIGIRKTNAHLYCTIYDLPEVCQFAAKRLTSYSEPGMIKVVEGNIWHDQLTEKADVVLLANVLHDWTVADGYEIIQKIYTALPEKGVLLVYEFFLEDGWQGPMHAMYHAVTVLGPDGESGWQPSFAEMEEMLFNSGFREIKRNSNLLIAKK